MRWALGAMNLDATMFGVVISLCLMVLIVDLVCWFRHLQSDSRTHEECWGDVRAMNTYNSYFMSAIVVFFGLVVDKGLDTVPISALIMFLAAFVSASSAIFFFPVQRPRDGAVSPGVRRRWFCALVPTQWTVILGTGAVVNIAVSLLTRSAN